MLVLSLKQPLELADLFKLASLDCQACNTDTASTMAGRKASLYMHQAMFASPVSIWL